MTARDNLARQQIFIPAAKPEEEITLRVAAYCRVSTDSDDQINSFIAQNNHYNELISAHDRWELVDIYADEGITGTSAKKRKDFQRMLADCRKGKIDKILVKSISRFARNTAECLEAVRELKSLGIGILFEEHNIDTKTVSSEMLTAVLASCAQAESETISKNMRWSYQKRMESGRFITCNAPFGYRLVDGTLEIEPKEAEIVREIFALYLQGFSTTEISEQISAIGMPTRTGSIQWGHKAICYILQNEKYIGDALLQKKYSTDTLPVKKVPNTGERNQYYVENSHPAIITKEVFDRVQMLYRSKRPEITGAKKQKHDLSLKIKCGKCGSYLHRKINGGILYWVCRKHNNTGDCDLMQILDATIKNTFLRFYYNLKTHPEILSFHLKTLTTVRNRQMLWSPEVVELNKKISDIMNQSHSLTLLNKQGVIGSDIFISTSNRLAEQLRKAKQQKENLLRMEDDKTIEITLQIIEVLSEGPDMLEAFDEELFCELIEKIVVESNTKIRFRLKNGLELPESIERTVR